MALGGVDVLALFFKMIRLKSKMLNCMLHLACLSIACICRSEVHTHINRKLHTKYTFNFFYTFRDKLQWLYPTRKIAIWIRQWISAIIDSIQVGEHWDNFDITDITRYFGIMWVTNGSFDLYLLGQHCWGIGLGETLASANEPGTPYRLVVQKEPPHEVRPVAKLVQDWFSRWLGNSSQLESWIQLAAQLWCHKSS